MVQGMGDKAGTGEAAGGAEPGPKSFPHSAEELSLFSLNDSRVKKRLLGKSEIHRIVIGKQHSGRRGERMGRWEEESLRAAGRSPVVTGGRRRGGWSRCRRGAEGAVRAGTSRAWCLLGCWGERRGRRRGTSRLTPRLLLYRRHKEGGRSRLKMSREEHEK